MKKISTYVFLLTLTLFACHTSHNPLPPSGLLCELMRNPEKTEISDLNPEFSWVVNSTIPGGYQTAYQLLVSSNQENIHNNNGDMWDSGRIQSAQSISAEYQGKSLSPGSTYYWKIKIWNKEDLVSRYSNYQIFHIAKKIEKYQTDRYPLEKRAVSATRIVKKAPGNYFVDFGKAAFGTVKMSVESESSAHEVEVLLGEKSKDSITIDDQPGGSIRFRKMILPPKSGLHTYTVPITPDERNTRERAIKMPDYIGEVMPFRYCEIINSPSQLDTSLIKQIAVNYPFDDSAALFTCSDKVLNDVWQFCKYSIKATSFCGVYVDGDRERIPYEADAYINQLSHYCVDREYTMARYTHEYLIKHPTWPTEWIMHSVLMAWADYLYTGDSESIAHNYDDLKAKTLTALARKDGLISTRTGLLTEEVLNSIYFNGELRDIVDWPPGSFTKGLPGERDGYVFTDINTVVNAFHYHTLRLMNKIAMALNKPEDADFFADRATLVKESINNKLLNKERGIYLDGENTEHASLHANMFPLVFDLVPEEYKNSVISFIKSRGMACSVYGAQYLLEALLKFGEAAYALHLMTNNSDRSWPHMIYDVGTTITLEAWDKKYKENLDWNHAWGSAPANIIPRFVMGVQPLEPGFAKVLIKPQVAYLEYGTLKCPTIRGTIDLDFKQARDSSFTLNLNLPANMKAKVCLPKLTNQDSYLEIDGDRYKGTLEGDFITVEDIGSGKHTFIISVK